MTECFELVMVVSAVNCSRNREFVLALPPHQSDPTSKRPSAFQIEQLPGQSLLPTMAKKRKSVPSSVNKMDLDDLPSSAPSRPKKSLLAANTHAGITKSTRLPRGKGRRAQRLRKEKGAERAEEVQARTERKVEISRGKGRRNGERNVSYSNGYACASSIEILMMDMVARLHGKNSIRRSRVRLPLELLLERGRWMSWEEMV